MLKKLCILSLLTFMGSPSHAGYADYLGGGYVKFPDVSAWMGSGNGFVEKVVGSYCSRAPAPTPNVPSNSCAVGGEKGCSVDPAPAPTGNCTETILGKLCRFVPGAFEDPALRKMTIRERGELVCQTSAEQETPHIESNEDGEAAFSGTGRQSPLEIMPSHDALQTEIKLFDELVLETVKLARQRQNNPAPMADFSRAVSSVRGALLAEKLHPVHLWIINSQFVDMLLNEEKSTRPVDDFLIKVTNHLQDSLRGLLLNNDRLETMHVLLLQFTQALNIAPNTGDGNTQKKREIFRSLGHTMVGYVEDGTLSLDQSKQLISDIHRTLDVAQNDPLLLDILTSIVHSFLQDLGHSGDETQLLLNP